MWTESESKTDACLPLPQEKLLFTPFAYASFQSLIYENHKKYRLQDFSNLGTSHFICCQDVVETSSPGPKDSVSRSARPRASVFGEALSQKKAAQSPPKLRPLRD